MIPFNPKLLGGRVSKINSGTGNAIMMTRKMSVPSLKDIRKVPSTLDTTLLIKYGWTGRRKTLRIMTSFLVVLIKKQENFISKKLMAFWG